VLSARRALAVQRPAACEGRVKSAALRPAPRVDDRHPGNALLADLLTGLGSAPKRLPSKYFYDARGSQLFERICEQPEYYLTRTELGIM
ncbi:L-histidine N(alpha)-methyltransferase, partial [Klebsiella pneumoniae]|uniref:L-histidine N(alpha)-methyltransferase n=1 Tax=Klebsiella pneumoniae TaxID=573 RepID=UPI0025A07734